MSSPVSSPTLKTVDAPCEISAELERIFDKDAERTFLNPVFQKILVQTLKDCYSIVQDYHQGMGFVVSFLLLFLQPSEVLTLINHLHETACKGYFKAASVSYVRDARVCMKIFKEKFPHIHKRIEDCCVPAEAFCSKWFVGLNIHVLTLEAETLFLENLFQQKTPIYLFQFALSLIQSCEEDLMKAKNASEVLEILRLSSNRYPITKSAKCDEKNISGSFFTKIVEEAPSFDISMEDVEALRMEVEEELYKEQQKRLQREAEV
ncbi:hypothetical protein IE077_000527 [Cardiosporidium cionae]|uniref:Rab-GAP TBC domain-containing protein n=1 Tax=Cardiosporidium cionae TaxID=476202 RepID=A0ABQ7J3X5_9APIC|nr:hypothetical protein IE077_000527 [Cardiosporidium cionae]|eukprot:KAF8817734.1 hypothetical protein IE077_000527 [Cardiosporidium cionae]